MKNAVFWDVAPCRSCELNRRLGGTYRLHLQGRKIRERGTSMSRWLQTEPPVENTQLYKNREGGPLSLLPSSLADFSILKIEAIRSSETSVHQRSTRCHIPEDGILHTHCRVNLKSYIAKVSLRREWWGEYVDLRGRKNWRLGNQHNGNVISFRFTLHQTLLKWLNQGE
jgi:hypothetical protein